MKTRTPSPCRLLVGLLVVACGCSGERVEAATLAQQPAPAASPKDQNDRAAPAQAATVADAPIPQFQRDLLHLAFQAASAFPLEPHHKSRSKAQEKVVLACLDLDQPVLAREWSQHIGDWRRGSCLADYAQYCAVHGDVAEAERCLKLAEQLAADVKNDPNPQEWRRDTILLKLARTYARLGKRKEAERFGAGLDPISGLAFDSGTAATAAGRADLITAENLAGELSAMDDLLVNEASGLTFAALVTCVRLFDKFYDDVERRDQIEKRIRVENAKLPPNYRLTALIEAGRIALTHGDTAKAVESLRYARDFFERTEWQTEVRIAFVAQLAALIGRSGNRELADKMLEDGLVAYQEARETFRGTKRAEILRPFAEAYHALGEADRAADLYTMVIEEGMENPNSRPRAEDISETCISMAKNAYAPDAKMLARIREIVGGLGDPW